MQLVFRIQNRTCHLYVSNNYSIINTIICTTGNIQFLQMFYSILTSFSCFPGPNWPESLRPYEVDSGRAGLFATGGGLGCIGCMIGTMGCCCCGNGGSGPRPPPLPLLNVLYGGVVCRGGMGGPSAIGKTGTPLGRLPDNGSVALWKELESEEETSSSSSSLYKV